MCSISNPIHMSLSLSFGVKPLMMIALLLADLYKACIQKHAILHTCLGHLTIQLTTAKLTKLSDYSLFPTPTRKP